MPGACSFHLLELRGRKTSLTSPMYKTLNNEQSREGGEEFSELHAAREKQWSIFLQTRPAVKLLPMQYLLSSSEDDRRLAERIT